MRIPLLYSCIDSMHRFARAFCRTALPLLALIAGSLPATAHDEPPPAGESAESRGSEESSPPGIDALLSEVETERRAHDHGVAPEREDFRLSLPARLEGWLPFHGGWGAAAPGAPRAVTLGSSWRRVAGGDAPRPIATRGGATAPAGGDGFFAGLDASWPLPGRLRLSLGYAPGWVTERVRTAGLDADRDLVVRVGRDESRLARVRLDVRRFRLDWEPAPGHHLAYAILDAPWRSSGGQAPDARRVRADAGWRMLDVVAVSAGPGLGAIARGTDRGELLAYRGELRGWTAGVGLSRFKAAERLDPDTAGESMRVTDLRRVDLYGAWSLAGQLPITAPVMYQAGGLGETESRRAAEARALAVHVGAPAVQWGGAHRISLGFAWRRDAESELRRVTGGPFGSGFYLRYFRGIPIPASHVSAPGGVELAARCANPDLGAKDAESACPFPFHQVTASILNPELPPFRTERRGAMLEDEWQAGAWTIRVGLERAELFWRQGGDYTLLSDLTGEALIGNDNFPVGTRYADVPTAEPEYLAGPGRFTGGQFRFPAEWLPSVTVRFRDRRGRRWSAGWRRELEAPPGDYIHHMLSPEFRVVNAPFNIDPDSIRQTNRAITEGGVRPRIAPGTRHGASDLYRIAVASDPEARWSASLAVEHRRLRRVLAMARGVPLEDELRAIYESFAGACVNCPKGEVYPGYDGFLLGPPRRLANPGANTDASLFPAPSRAETRVEFGLRADLPRGVRVILEGAHARARGNWRGYRLRDNGVGHPEIDTQYSHPRSPLTEGDYLDGPLDPEVPTGARLEFARPAGGDRRFGIALAWDWRRGALRTPLLADPLSQFPGAFEGEAADYYLFDLTYDGLVDHRALRGYTPVRHGAGGRMPDRHRLDLTAEFRGRLAGGELRIHLGIGNLLNHDIAAALDEQLESSRGYPDAHLETAGRIPGHDLPYFDPFSRFDNPDRGAVTARMAPRSFAFGVSLTY